MFMRFVWAFGVGHTYSHSEHSIRRQQSSGTTGTGNTNELTSTGASTSNFNSPAAVTGLLVNADIDNEAAELEDDSTWAMSDQDDDSDVMDSSGSDLKSIPSQGSDEIPDDL
jgi:hypothetical protein